MSYVKQNFTGSTVTRSNLEPIEAYLEGVSNMAYTRQDFVGSTVRKSHIDHIEDFLEGFEGGGSEPVDENRKVYTGVITETIKGTSAYAVLVQDDVLAQHRNDDTLFVRVSFDVAQEPYTVISVWQFNDHINPFDITMRHFVRRYDASGTVTANRTDTPLNADSPLGVGCLLITESGELRCHSMSSNYAILPSNYTVVVEW